MLRLENHEDFVEIDLAGQDKSDLPSQGDGYVTIRVSSAEFTGHNHVWVGADALRSFSRALIALERHRQGEAIMDSLSPGELKLRIRSVDSLGHMAVDGSAGHHIQRGKLRTWHAVYFGFEFDPAQLVKAISIDWVRDNG